MKEIGIGVIGAGMMGKTHSYAYRNLPLYYPNLPFRARLTGICSSHLANAEKLQADLGYAFATDDYQEILNSPDIDAVSICTPNNRHLEMILAAIQAGKHIYCEKPLVVNAAEADAVLQALDGHPLVNQVVFHLRFYPATLRARQLIDEGRIGRILSFRAAFLHAGSVDPGRPVGWKQDQAAGGGVLLDLGSHVLDLMRWLIGDYRRLLAKTGIIYPLRPGADGNLVEVKAEDSVQILAEMQNGSLGTLEATKVATGYQDDMRFEIHGDRGAIRFSLMEPDWLEFYDNTLPEEPLGGCRGFTRIECVGRYAAPSGGFPSVKSGVGWLRGHVHCLYSFLACAAQNRPATPSFADGAYIQKIMGLASESDRLGRWVDCG